MLNIFNIGEIMTRNQFVILNMIISGSLGAVVGYAVSSGNFLLSFIAVVVALFLVVYLRKKTNLIIFDERVFRVSEKASRKTLNLFLVISSIVGLLLITKDKNNVIGYTLLYSVCFLLILYLILYAFYNTRKL
ncbi:MAG: hypothetical protein PWP03_609 [Candidatus Woesearchaeota archaeon]|nr:hypothetical protein [Candidatus Woesearchaeota archaeon]MDN5327971.1 hypothetical protein [Candidatus Woesearchaeota archaeon]